MMTDTGLSTAWAVVIIVVVPALVIIAAEIDERLRQRESALRSAVQLVRNWVLPFFALWAIAVPVLGADEDNVVTLVAASGLVLSIGAVLLRVLRVIVDDVRERPRAEGRRPVPQLLLALPRLGIIIATGWILVGSVWGVDLSAALTALGVTSLVISFALQDTLSGLASGVLLLSDPPFQPGDWIESGDVEGLVVDVGWRTTRVETRDGDTIVIPNSELAGASITNFSAPRKLHRVVVPVQVAYKNPPTLAKAMLLDAARGTAGVLTDPEPNVVVVQIDDPLMGYEVHMWVDDYAIVPRVKSDFGSLVWYQSYRHDVPLPSPAQDLYLWDGPATEAAGAPTTADIRDMLRAAPILTTLNDADLDALARASRPARFKIGEYLLDSRQPTRDVVLIRSGRAGLSTLGPGGVNLVVAELSDGEIIDLATTSPPGGEEILLRALTDCEVVIVNADALGEIGSRNVDVADAFNRVSAIRRRRVERMAASRSTAPDADEAGE